MHIDPGCRHTHPVQSICFADLAQEWNPVVVEIVEDLIVHDLRLRGILGDNGSLVRKQRLGGVLGDRYDCQIAAVALTQGTDESACIYTWSASVVSWVRTYVNER
jgi:hypothetical protein